MTVLATHCPCCNSKHAIVAVRSWPLLTDLENDEDPVEFKLCGVDKEGDSCCSYDEFRYATRPAADAAALDWNEQPDLIADYAQECKANGDACEDAHGYFMDYGPVDSDPYD